jgi:hypothetical protein
MKVKVTDGYQIVDKDGKVRTSGTVEVAEPQGSFAVQCGWATVVADEPEPEPDEDDDTEQVDVSGFHVGGGWYEIDGERYRGEQAARAAFTS